MYCIKAVISAVAATTAAVVLSTASMASTLETVQGGVLVNRGSGFVRSSSGTQLKPGDRVMANPGGNATVAYSGGCFAVVPTGTIYTVQPENYCELATTKTAATTTAPNLTPYVVGAGLIGGGIAGAFLLTQSGGSKPASP